jgi:hypothetical protein
MDIAMQRSRMVGDAMRLSSLSKTVGSSSRFISEGLTNILPCIALSLAISRDGSSGGVIRMCVITKEGVERLFVPGDQLPKFWEGLEVLENTKKLRVEPEVVPMAVEV